MKAFFDTNIYFDFLKGRFPKLLYDSYFKKYIIRICPVVYQELIRCIRSGEVKKRVERMTRMVAFLPAPTVEMWKTAGEIAGQVAGSHDERTLESIQNDLLIALTARENGALLITQDKFFRAIQKHVPFQLILHVSEKKQI
ncbi:MAG: PIN domain-containing protein [Deltaproteobacteria bacterium]|nr:PIN domain-containing protein [Deltaproteobacteria bacterium]